MVKLNMEDRWIAMYQGIDEVEQVAHRYHRMEEEEQQDPQEREQLASIFGGDGADYKPESGSSSNYHREPPKDGRPYSTLCNVCPTYVYNEEKPKIKKEDNRDWHEEPPKNGEPYTVLETDPPLYEYKEIANPVGGEPIQQTLDVPLLEIPVELLPAKKRKQTVAKKRNNSRKQVKKKAKKEKEKVAQDVVTVNVDQPDAALQQQQIPVVEQVTVAPSVTVQNESQPLQQQQPYPVPVSYYYPPWQPPFPISYWQPVAYYPPMPPYYTAAAAAELPSQAR